MSRGLGGLQDAVLSALSLEEGIRERLGNNRKKWHFDPISDDYWIPAAALSRQIAYGDDTWRRTRADEASLRRSVRSLRARGLVDCKMMDLPISQRDPLYAKSHDIIRTVLMVRFTDAGRRASSRSSG